MSGVPGTRPARVTVIGGGVAGANATVIAAGLGADVTVFDTNIQRLRYLDDHFQGASRRRHPTRSISTAPSRTPTSSSARC